MGASGGAELRQRDAAVTTEGHWNRPVGEDPIDRRCDGIVRIRKKISGLEAPCSARAGGTNCDRIRR